MPPDPPDRLRSETGGLLMPQNPFRQDCHEVFKLPVVAGNQFAQRNRADRIGAEPVIKIVAESFCAACFAEVAIGRGDDFPPEFQQPVVAEPLEFAALQHPQQFHLGFRRNFTDLIKKDAAGFHAAFKVADSVAGRAGESSLAVAEQLGFDHGLGHGRKLHRQEARGIRIGEAAGFRVERDILRQRDRPGHQFLSGPGFAGDQRGDAVHLVVEHTEITVDVVAENRLPDRGAQAARRQRSADDEAENMVKGAVNLKENREAALRFVAEGGFASGISGKFEKIPGEVTVDRIFRFIRKLNHPLRHRLTVFFK